MKSEHNPARYREMSIPHESPEKLAENVEGFNAAVEEARIKYRMRDVLIVAESSAIGENGKEGEFISTSHFGDQMKAVALAAYLYGKLRTRFEEILSQELKGK